MRLALFLVLLAPAALAQPAAPALRDVAYRIDATLTPEDHRLTARQEIRFTNGTADTLDTAYLHLYFNAFDPASAMAERNRHLPDPDPRVVPRIHDLSPEEVGWTRVEGLRQDGKPVPFDVTDTALRMALPAPLAPGEATTLMLNWAAQVPLQTRRSGRDSDEGIDFSMAQWYPKLAMLDDAGWHPDLYVGREFYAPFARYDVMLTVPSDYVVAATGVLQNPEAIGHGYDAAVDAGPTRNGPALQADGAAPDSLGYHFLAERVHDFTWAADPDYIHERVAARGVFAEDTTRVLPLHFFYQPDVAERWQGLSSQLPPLIAAYNEIAGAYPYPQFSVVQGGDGGMEYPMLTLITGRRTPGSVYGVTAHEMAHMWYYGVLGTNEARHAWMDEGFTQWLQTEGIHRALGRPGRPGHAGALLRILGADQQGLRYPIDYRSDWYPTNLAYSVASYSGGEAFLHALGGVIGDSLRDATLLAYFDRWAFAHPGPDDFVAVAESVSGLELGWFADQFLKMTPEYAYALHDVRATPAGEDWVVTLALEREAEGVMPLDVALEFEGGQWAVVHVPVDAALGHRPLRPGEIATAPVAWTAERFEVTLRLPARPVRALLDPDLRLLEVNRLDNRWVRSGLDTPLAFDGFFRAPTARWSAFSYTLAPLGAYSSLYGWGSGLQLRGAAAFGRRQLKAAAFVWPAVFADPDRGSTPANDGSALNGLDYTLRYRHPLSPRVEWGVTAEKHLGIWENRVHATWALDDWPALRPFSRTLTATLGHQARNTTAAFRAPSMRPVPDAESSPGEALTGFVEGHLVSARVDGYVGDGASWLRASAETGHGLSNPEPAGEWQGRRSATRAWLDAQRTVGLGPAVLRLRGLAGIGADDLVAQKRFRLGAVPLEERWRSASFRWPAAAMDDPLGDAHFIALSGVGPVAYHLADRRSTLSFGASRVLSGRAAVAAPLPRFEGMDRSMAAVLAPLEFEAFSGAGQLWERHARTGWLADAGLGARYDVGRLAPFFPAVAQSDVLRGLRLTAAFPIWVSEPDRFSPGERAWAFRWLFGVEVGS